MQDARFEIYCHACKMAHENLLSGLYSTTCDNCKARALANGFDLFESKRAGVKSPEYAAALRKVFGEGNEEAGHERVKAWSKRITQHKKGTA